MHVQRQAVGCQRGQPAMFRVSSKITIVHAVIHTLAARNVMLSKCSKVLVPGSTMTALTSNCRHAILMLSGHHEQMQGWRLLS